MLDIFKKNKILFIIFFVVTILFILYGASDHAPSGTLIQKRSSTESSPVEQEILQLLMDVQSIKLDSAIFDDPAFARLRDFSRGIVQEPAGKVNPFSPSEEVGTATTTDEQFSGN